LAQSSARVRAAAVQAGTSEGTMTRRPRAAIGGGLVLLLSVPTTTHAQAGASPRASEHWVTTWATAQQLAPTRLPFGTGEIVQPPASAHVPAPQRSAGRAPSSRRIVSACSIACTPPSCALSPARRDPDTRSPAI